MTDVDRFLGAIAAAETQPAPFRHFTMAAPLDPAWAAEIGGADVSAHLLRLRDRRGTRISDRRFSAPLLPGPADGLPAPVRRLRDLFANPAVGRALLARFADVIAGRLRSGARVRASLDLIEDRSGYALPPHTDQTPKLVTLLLYLADAPPGVDIGTTIYRPLPNVAPGQGPRHHDRALFADVKTVPHRANTALCFAPCANSFHGVEPVAAGARRFLAQYHLIAATEADLRA